VHICWTVGRRGCWARTSLHQCPAFLRTPTVIVMSGVMISGGSWDFVGHFGQRSTSPCQLRGQPWGIPAPAFHPSSELLYIGGPLGKASSIWPFFTCSPGSPALPLPPDIEVSWLEQQGEPRNQTTKYALCTTVLLPPSAASPKCCVSHLQASRPVNV